MNPLNRTLLEGSQSLQHFFCASYPLFFYNARSAEVTNSVRYCILWIALALQLVASEDEHLFSGKHFVASYIGCNQRALADLQGMLDAMDGAVRASGATVLNCVPHIFPPNGLTVVYLLSESHASLHTYPEYGACFVDLFTCGEHPSPERFDMALREYLRPEAVNARLFLRHEGTEEVAYEPFRVP
ncbi:MAG: adenosylmethionine decarboxylase [Chlamydiota bacterium]|jgi:S-adenosylmethionine decarboxylase